MTIRDWKPWDMSPCRSCDCEPELHERVHNGHTEKYICCPECGIRTPGRKHVSDAIEIWEAVMGDGVDW